MKMTRAGVASIIALLMLAGGFWSCQGKFPGYKKTDNGLYYKFHVKSDCDAQAKPGDIISFKMKVYAEDTVFSDDFMEYERQVMDSSRYKGDLYEALGMMCAGDSATFILSADSLKQYFGFEFGLDSAAFIYADIVMKEILTSEMIAAEEDSLMKAETATFEAYKTANLTGFNELLPGVHFLKSADGKGPAVNDTAILSVKIIGTSLEGDTFWEASMDPIDFRIEDDNQIPFNWNSALRELREGGKGRLVLTSPNAFGKRGFRQGMVKPYQPVILDIEIVKVSAGMKEFEGYSIGQFVKRNKITEKPVAGGMYFVRQQEGTGAKLKSGDKVMVHYTGFYLDMGVFDSSRQKGEPMEVIIDKSDVIKGWHQALKMMKVGERARIIIPSSLGYGADGYPPVIRPYSPLVFDLEVVEKI
ncbi:MAG TPA: FKBP-type peptidyl-prolyl cis-trans isomerase [Bacteroidales bacterium]|nr:FKBP-type peptidyl-prolyl cis-trans isomerase [Bacteroidales bacterium]HRZ49370.1 FKBP-type peptidyl-prolyl cis-trans isomerase [Bacteroidales bacterium]